MVLSCICVCMRRRFTHIYYIYIYNKHRYVTLTGRWIKPGSPLRRVPMRRRACAMLTFYPHRVATHRHIDRDSMRGDTIRQPTLGRESRFAPNPKPQPYISHHCLFYSCANVSLPRRTWKRLLCSVAVQVLWPALAMAVSSCGLREGVLSRTDVPLSAPPSSASIKLMERPI